MCYRTREGDQGDGINTTEDSNEDCDNRQPGQRSHTTNHNQ